MSGYDLIIVDTKIGDSTERIALQVAHKDTEYAQIALLRGGAKIIKIQNMDVVAQQLKGQQ